MPYPDSENFDSLRRLLALKRHEQPPPGYFHHFSREVVVRIQAGERGEDPSFVQQLLGDMPWLLRFWSVLEAKPIVAGAVGAAACGLLVAGIYFSQGEDLSEPQNRTAAMVVHEGDLVVVQRVDPDAHVVTAFGNGSALSSLGGMPANPAQPINVTFPAN